MVPKDCVGVYETNDDFYGTSYYLALGLGCILVLSQVIDVLLLTVPQQWKEGNSWVKSILRPGGRRQERVGQKAACHRMKSMLQNALSISDDGTKGHRSNSNRNMHAIERYFLVHQTTENCGGVMWAWKKIFNGSMFSEEGVWLSSRLLTINFVQWMVVGMIIFFVIVLKQKQQDFFYSDVEKSEQLYVTSFKTSLLAGNATGFQEDQYIGLLNCTQYSIADLLVDDLVAVDDLVLADHILVAEEYGEVVDFYQPQDFVIYLQDLFGTVQAALDTSLATCAQDFAPAALFIVDVEIVFSYQPDELKDLVASVDITESQYVRAAYCGLAAGLLASLWIAIVLIPSYISTALKLRSGVIPTLKEEDFLRYRVSMDNVTVLLGSAFWGSLFTSAGAMFLTMALVLGSPLLHFLLACRTPLFAANRT